MKTTDRVPVTNAVLCENMGCQFVRTEEKGAAVRNGKENSHYSSFTQRPEASLYCSNYGKVQCDPEREIASVGVLFSEGRVPCEHSHGAYD